MTEPKTAEVKVADRLAEIISDDEITRVHGHANFGSMSPREVVNDGVRKSAIGYHCGHTQVCILREHGLITAQRGLSHDVNLTKKGKKYARELLHTTLFPAPSHIGEAAGMVAPAQSGGIHDAAARLFAKEYPDRDYDRLDLVAQMGWMEAAWKERAAPAPQAEGEQCKYCGPGVITGLPGNACENCMGTGLENPPEDTEASAWAWVQNRYPNDAASDLAFDANEMVDAYMAGFGSKAPQPLQQGGEVTREELGDLAGLVERLWCRLDDGDAFSAAAALESLAADRDKAVGLLREIAPLTAHGTDRQRSLVSDFLSSQTGGS